MSAIASFTNAPLSSGLDSRDAAADARRRGSRADEQESATRFLLTLLGASVIAACIGAGAAVATAAPAPQHGDLTTAASPDPTPPLVHDGDDAGRDARPTTRSSVPLATR